MTRYTNLPVGTRIYYTGDMANQPGAGIITRCFSDEWYASQYDIKLDDGRKMRSIHPSNFGEAGTRGGFRFELQSERDAFRNAYMAAHFPGQDDALGISCPICHAPVDIQCVRIIWDAKDGQYIPRLIQRDEAHGKRVRAFEKV